VGGARRDLGRAQQAPGFVELACEFVDKQAKDIFQGDRKAESLPTALTVFVWVLLMILHGLPADRHHGAFWEHVCISALPRGATAGREHHVRAVALGWLLI